MVVGAAVRCLVVRIDAFLRSTMLSVACCVVVDAGVGVVVMTHVCDRCFHRGLRIPAGSTVGSVRAYHLHACFRGLGADCLDQRNVSMNPVHHMSSVARGSSASGVAIGIYWCLVVF